jgi:rhodanese-related sulfurtransferase
LPALDDAHPVAVHCKSGYRSMIACSLLERAGHRNLINVAGGFDAWHDAGLPEDDGNWMRASWANRVGVGIVLLTDCGV